MDAPQQPSSSTAPNTAQTDLPLTDELQPQSTSNPTPNPNPNPTPNPKPAAPKKQRTVPNSDRPPGKSLLPTARVQRILKADKELSSCNKEAVFLISVAAEEFIKRLGQAGHQDAIREKRTTVQRKDITTAVRRGEEFIFLEELLSMPVMTAPPVKPRKTKPTTANAAATAATHADSHMNIKEAFGKGAKLAKSAGRSEEDGDGDDKDNNEGKNNNISEESRGIPDLDRGAGDVEAMDVS